MSLYNWIDNNLLLPVADMATGTSIYKKHAFLMKSQWWTQAQIDEYQNEKLRALINHAYENVPYYHRTWKQLNIRPEDIKTVSDLKKIPILTKEIIKKNYDDFKSNDFNSRRPKQHATGGSTGEPLKFWMDWETYSYLTGARMRGWSYADYRLGDKMVALGGSSISPMDKPGLKDRVKDDIIFRKTGFSAFDMGPERINSYLEEINKIRPKYIFGYPSSLAIFADSIPRGYSGFSDLKAAFTTAEVLQMKDRKTIENSLGVRVFDGYGAADGGINAMECNEHHGLHQSAEIAIMEFVKENEDVALGESGTVLSTDLTNFSFPFIRYEVGDTAIPEVSPCSCGRKLPLIREVSGRTTDVIRFTDGTQWGGPALTLVFARFDIYQYQVIQEAVNTIKILLIKGKNFSTEDEKELKFIFESHVGKDGTVEIECVNEIQNATSGKRKFIISKVVNE